MKCTSSFALTFIINKRNENGMQMKKLNMWNGVVYRCEDAGNGNY